MVLIIGAGLSGLLTAYRLKKSGIPFKILEARKRIGGRIHTLNSERKTPLEMGATWFTYQHPHLINLLNELDISYFEQYMKGKAFYQPYANSPAESVNLPQSATSYRMTGGTHHLIQTLYKKLDESDVYLNQSVTKIEYKNNSFVIDAKEQFEADKIVLAIPPKLWVSKISFEPNLPVNLIETAKKPILGWKIQ